MQIVTAPERTSKLPGVHGQDNTTCAFYVGREDTLLTGLSLKQEHASPEGAQWLVQGTLKHHKKPEEPMIPGGDSVPQVYGTIGTQ